MGGPLMERILKDGAKVREGFQELILQPQSDLPHFQIFFLRSAGDRKRRNDKRRWKILSYDESGT